MSGGSYNYLCFKDESQALFGGQSNFEAVLEKVEQTRGKCERCDGKGKVLAIPFTGVIWENCHVCGGSGLGKVRVERIVVLDEDQNLPHLSLCPCGDCWRDIQQNMLQAGFRKVKQERK